MITKYKRLEDANELQKGTLVSRSEDGRLEESTGGPLAPQDKSELSWSKVWDLDKHHGYQKATQ